VSETARRVYRGSAALSGMLVLIIITFPFVRQVHEGFLPFLRLLVFLGVLGTAITMVAMEYFLFGFDTSSALKKAFWFCVMLFPPIGPFLYCFVVYLRSDVLKRAQLKGVSAGL
jgi:hypothetical protein